MEVIHDRQEHYLLKRDGRFLVAALQTPHQVLSTSPCSGGMADGVRFLANHQSCEGRGHLERFEWMKEIGETGYHRHVCEQLGLEPEPVAMMGTAANMHYAALVVATFAELRVCAVVTAESREIPAARAIPRTGMKPNPGRWRNIPTTARSIRCCSSTGRLRPAPWPVRSSP